MGIKYDNENIIGLISVLESFILMIFFRLLIKKYINIECNNI